MAMEALTKKNCLLKGQYLQHFIHPHFKFIDKLYHQERPHQLTGNVVQLVLFDFLQLSRNPLLLFGALCDGCSEHLQKDGESVFVLQYVKKKPFDNLKLKMD